MPIPVFRVEYGNMYQRINPKTEFKSLTAGLYAKGSDSGVKDGCNFKTKNPAKYLSGVLR